MRNEYCIKFDYGNRDKGIKTICEINSLVEPEGYVTVFVNNNPYCMEFLCCIGAELNLSQLITRDNLEVFKGQGHDELFDEALLYRKYNLRSLHQRYSNEACKALVEDLFVFADKQDISEKFTMTPKLVKPKVFISYSHNDKKLVYLLVEEMKNKGINVWIDMQDISVGENILNMVSLGLKEADVAVMFLSKGFRDSKFATFELNTVFNNLILSKQRIFPVKLDDVNINEIFNELVNIKYYDLHSNGNIDGFLLELKKVIATV